MALLLKALVLIAACFVVVASKGLEVVNDEDSYPHIDCHSLYKAGYTKNGTYRLSAEGEDYLAPCEFVGGYAYTNVMGRFNNKVNFDQSYQSYRFGFGNPVDGFFIGLDRLHFLTSAGNVVLYMIFRDWNNSPRWFENRGFFVGDYHSGYTLVLGSEIHGSASDDILFNGGQKFYTKDHSDRFGCARKLMAGWWYNGQRCTKALPTGHYYNQGPYGGQVANGIYWSGWHGYRYSLKSFGMAVRRLK